VNKKERRKKVAQLMKLNWEIKVIDIPNEEGGGYCACIPLLGENLCRADGETVFEAIKALEVTLSWVLEDYLEQGYDIPTTEKKEKEPS